MSAKFETDQTTKKKKKKCFLYIFQSNLFTFVYPLIDMGV